MHIFQRKSAVIFALLIWMLLWVGTEATQAISMQVAPHRFVFSIEQPNTQEAVVTNISDHPVRVKIYFEMAPNQSKDEYLGDWAVVSPQIISLKPNEKKTVRFSIRPPKGLKDGEYRAFLFFEELYDKPADNTQVDNVQLNFQLLTKLGVNVYGQTGKIIHKGELQDVKLAWGKDQLTVKGMFVNQGNAHILADVHVQLLNEKQQVVKNETITAFAIHRSTSEEFTYTTELKDSGKYTLKLTFKMDNQDIYEFVRTFEVSNGQIK